MPEDEWLCICGKATVPPALYCSSRCRYIAEQMNSPRGQRIDNIDRAIKVFGKQYDTNHGTKP